MEDLACSWSPKLIVDLIKSIAWPVVVLLIGFSFRIRIFDVVRSFFSKNTVSEISATVSGVSAKFMASKQSTEVLETSNSNAANLPKFMSVEAIRKRHEQQKTEFSDEICQDIIKHVSSLDIDNEVKIDLLSREVSLCQSVVRYFEINKVLFRSQYNLFYIITSNGGYISKEDALQYFDKTKSNNKEAFMDWDWIKYISYPVSNNLIYEDDNSYKLTPIGRSYVAFMSKKPQLIDELVKL
ncbi:hypothetical protein [Dickeya dadantii]|uniref:hypothetical protein n=1 Tax=Dickeya dadantii TaxID=204038 RepID=UPI001CC5AFEA|nr:hypothetical protein [Dickeya dadantii]UAY97098.1 hypothetical protein KTF62_04120 [Dickeya dadantii]